jgi:tetratricopeptide (TPR) repeat protein
MAHNHLGNALKARGEVKEAIACYKKAVAVDPKYAKAYCNLGQALARQGRFAESWTAYQRGHELGTKQSVWEHPSAQWVRQAKRLAALEARLPAVLEGEDKPSDTAERLDLIQVCQAKKLHHAATRLYTDAFAADPRLADDLNAGQRYNAACSAALAAAGQGQDAGKLDDRQRVRLRQQALNWLRADLTLLAAGEIGRSRVARILSHWRKDSNLAGLRDREALAKLPADEQKAFTQLWADVAELLKKAQTPAK